jgi:hypothetical protein
MITFTNQNLPNEKNAPACGQPFIDGLQPATPK